MLRSLRQPHPLLAGLLLAAPTTGFAQNVLPRYYAGAGLYSSLFQPLSAHYGRTTLPVQVQAGYRWHPRWAVQLGAIYSGYADGDEDAGQWVDQTGTPTGTYSYTWHTTIRQVSVALLVRRTLTRQRAHRCQFDLAGASLTSTATTTTPGITYPPTRAIRPTSFPTTRASFTICSSAQGRPCACE